MALEPSGGGSGRHVLDLAAGVAEHGHQVTIAYSDVRAELAFIAGLKELRDCHVVTLPMRRSISWRDPAALGAMRSLHRDLGPFDLVHGHSSKAGALGRLAAPAGSARVYTPHCLATMVEQSHTKRWIYARLERALARGVSEAIIAVSEAERAHALSVGIPPDLLHVVVNGVRAVNYLSRASAREQLGLGPDETAVGQVGRLSFQKDPLRFVEALAIARREAPRLVGVLIGHGEEMSAVEGRIAKLGLQGSVRIASHPDAAIVMPGLDLFCLSSRSEGMPYALLEALQCGLPIVATAAGGVPELVTHGQNGLVVGVDAPPAALGRAMAELAQSEELRRTFARRSREVAEQYTVDRMVDETLTVYDIALDRVGRVLA